MSVVVGIGTRKGVSADEVVEAVMLALEEVGVSLDEVEVLTSATIKQGEKGLVEGASRLKKHVKFIPSEYINAIHPPSKSRANDIGLSGVAESSVLAYCNDVKIVLPKRVYGRVTVAIGER